MHYHNHSLTCLLLAKTKSRLEEPKLSRESVESLKFTINSLLLTTATYEVLLSQLKQKILTIDKQVLSRLRKTMQYTQHDFGNRIFMHETNLGNGTKPKQKLL